MTFYYLYEKLKSNAAEGLIALIDTFGSFSYQILCETIEDFRQQLRLDYRESTSIILYGDYDLMSIALLWAALLENRVVMPVTTTGFTYEELSKLIDADLIWDAKQSLFTEITRETPTKDIIAELRTKQKAGLVLLSSGTTGRPKAILHDAGQLLKKYLKSRRRFITVALMLFDHIAGLDTMLHTLCAGGTLLIPRDKTVKSIIEVVHTHQAEVLPASPSLLQLLMMDPKFEGKYLTSLKVITFGSERITDDLKEKLQCRFNDSIELIQKYGLTEIGNPATITKPDDPRFIKFNTGLVDYKIIDDVLYLRTSGSLLGFLSDSGFEPHIGWFNTQDKVEIDGEWIKILGRVTDIINVGGQKVYPAEVESILQSMDGVISATVFGKDNPLMGKIVASKVHLDTDENLPMFKKRMRTFCKDKLESFKIPVDVELVTDLEISARFKKVRT